MMPHTYIHKDSDLKYESLPIKYVKAVVFAHFALMPLQKGLQAAHVISDIVRRNYNARELMGEMASQVTNHAGEPIEHPALIRNLLTDQWLHKDKTILIKDGGNSASLSTINGLLNHSDLVLMLPIGNFYEDQETMGGILTGVGAIVPSGLLELAEQLRQGEVEFNLDPSLKLNDIKLCKFIQLLAETRLAT